MSLKIKMFIMFIATVSATDYIKLEKKWVENVRYSTDYHQECLNQYNRQNIGCPSGWTTETEYLNVGVGTQFHSKQGNWVMLNCEIVTLCKSSYSV